MVGRESGEPRPAAACWRPVCLSEFSAIRFTPNSYRPDYLFAAPYAVPWLAVNPANPGQQQPAGALSVYRSSQPYALLQTDTDLIICSPHHMLFHGWP